MRPLCLLVLSCGIAIGQFHNLATVDDGSLLVFSSSLQMRGTDQVPYDKLFAIDSSGLRLYAQREKQEINSRLTNAYRMEGADFSGDGSVRVLLTLADCYGGSGCIALSKCHSEVYGVPGQDTIIYSGFLRISRNGRYAVTCCDPVSPPPPRLLIDLSDGRSRSLVGAVPDLSSRRIVSSTGKVVLPGASKLYVQDLERLTEIPTSAQPEQALIDDDGGVAVYAGSKVLARVDLATAMETTLVSADDLRLVGLSNDGTVVTYLSGHQLFLVDGAGPRQLTQDPSGVSEAAVSGSGAVAYATTADGKILKIDVASGASTELLGRLGNVALLNPTNPPFAVPGSAFCAGGTGLAQTPASAAPPLPTSLGGLQLLLDGQPVPLLSVTPSSACFQVPWNTAIGTHTLAAESGAMSPFKQDAELQVQFSSFVSPVYLEGLSALAAHADFSALVTSENPASPGEMVHFYMTGLGPVSPPVADGAPPPANPPAALIAPLVCNISDAGSNRLPVEVLFAGLAPGFTGYYQVSVRLPAALEVRGNMAEFRCWSGEEWAGQVALLPLALR